jgi:uncharacterized protein
MDPFMKRFLAILLLAALSGCQPSNAPQLVSVGSNQTDRTSVVEKPARSSEPLSPAMVERQIAAFRAEKDRSLKQADESPIPVAEREKFQGLKYYPIDLKYRMESVLERYQNPESIKMATTAGAPDTFLRYGKLKFKIDGEDYALDVFKSANDQSPRFFIPFRDKTSGKETYGAGRYLELEDDGSARYTLDFNLAYNPFCAYNETYSCPLPPPQNTLKVAVTAGEKSYHD